MGYLKKDGSWANQQTLKCNNPTANYDTLKEQRHEAQRKLSPSAYIMWTELSDNANGFEWKLSQVYFQKECGLSEASYKRAKKDLEEHNYIVWCDDKRTYGYFNRNGKPYVEPEKSSDSEGEEEATDFDSLMKSKKKKKNKAGKMITFSQFAKSCWQAYYDSAECHQNEERTKNKLIEIWLSVK